MGLSIAVPVDLCISSPAAALSSHALRRTAPNRKLDRRTRSFPEGAFLAIMMLAHKYTLAEYCNR